MLDAQLDGRIIPVPEPTQTRWPLGPEQPSHPPTDCGYPRAGVRGHKRLWRPLPSCKPLGFHGSSTGLSSPPHVYIVCLSYFLGTYRNLETLRCVECKYNGFQH